MTSHLTYLMWEGGGRRQAQACGRGGGWQGGGRRRPADGVEGGKTGEGLRIAKIVVAGSGKRLSKARRNFGNSMSPQIPTLCDARPNNNLGTG